MADSIGQKIKVFLENPLYKKGSLFPFLFPILLTLSLIIHLISLNRRNKSYKKITDIKSVPDYNFDNLKLICIGNILIGGTGKSPVVQKIAKTYLDKGFIVAIAARGIGKNIKSIYCNNTDPVKNLDFLSDENREHFELLNKHSENKGIFYILQNKKRIESLQFLLNEIKNKNYHNLKAILILDDGLQHFSCPRDVNICLWSPELLLESPYYAMPMGPYREGFGKNSFQRLLNCFDFRLWSRTKENDKEEYKSKIKLSLKRFNLEPNKKDIIAVYRTNYFNIKFIENKIKLENFKLESELNHFFTSSNSVTIITGIANPKNLISDLSSLINKKNVITLFLNDHGELNHSAIQLIKNSTIMIMTLKDIFRWASHPIFIDLIKEKNIIGCSVDVHFETLDNIKTEVF
ncbi:tetraacyldisaccharide 4'-kinase [Silvanigrella aquatica]|uniref:Tetraacyldisaccharide 4'-kinase n=1 Tax=Silvanigrella aquatica TaxID=1915309 RepID=A0A1L4D3P2_9BACT|nr:tetraacyldisaccharide 4'-kinase [Silvanigrella aquatica]APJ04834.1 hypothetical protein AXG55_13375 [Silvanigrella aquatica]